MRPIVVFALFAAVCVVRGSSRYDAEPDVKTTSGDAEQAKPQLVTVGPTLISSPEFQQRLSQILLPQPPAPAALIISPDDVPQVSPQVTKIEPKILEKTADLPKVEGQQSSISTVPFPAVEEQKPTLVVQAQPESQPETTDVVQATSQPEAKEIEKSELTADQAAANFIPFNPTQRVAQNPTLLQRVPQNSPTDSVAPVDFVPFNPSQRLAQNPSLLKKIPLAQPVNIESFENGQNEGLSVIVTPITSNATSDLAKQTVPTVGTLDKLPDAVLNLSAEPQPQIADAGNSYPTLVSQPEPQIANETTYFPALVIQPEPQIADDTDYLPPLVSEPVSQIADDTNFFPGQPNQVQITQVSEPQIADDSNYLPDYSVQGNGRPDIIQHQLVSPSPNVQTDAPQNTDQQIQTISSLPVQQISAPQILPFFANQADFNAPAQKPSISHENQPSDSDVEFPEPSAQFYNQNNRPAAPSKILGPKPENFPGPIAKPQDENPQNRPRNSDLTPDKWVNRRSSTQQTDVNYFKQRDGSNNAQQPDSGLYGQTGVFNIGFVSTQQQPQNEADYPTYVSESSYRSPAGSNPQVNSWSRTSYQNTPNSQSFSQAQSVSSNGNWVQVIPSNNQPYNNSQQSFSQQSYSQSYNNQVLNVGAARY